MNSRHIIENYYRHHRDELLAYVSSRLGGSDLAEDIVQDVFVQLMSGCRPIAESTLPSLVYTMARHRIVDYYRRRAASTGYALQARLAIETNYSVEPVIFARETIAHIQRRLERLPESCKQVYRMHIWEGMQVSEISSRLGADYKAVEYRLGKARREIRNYLRHTS